MQLQPQHTTIDDLRRGWRDIEALGVDTIWVWDHFFPLHGDPAGAHFEAWTLLTALALDTTRAQIGTLVSSSSYRNPELLVDMARTVDHLSSGRLALGIGSGWKTRDHKEYGYDLGTAGSRLRALESALHRIARRREQLNPPPIGPLPLLIGGGGEKFTLRLVAEHATMWNSHPPLEVWAHKSAVLDEWCAKLGRDPSSIERSVLLSQPPTDAEVDAWLAAGATHLIVSTPHPFDLAPFERLLSLA